MSAQRSIAQECTISGIGLHSGESCNMCVKPAPVNSGIIFVRTDLPGEPQLSASPDLLCQRMRRTALAQGDIEVHTTEHFLAAVSGLHIDNLLVELDNVELPGLDGSAQEFAKALKSAEIVEQESNRKTIELDEPISVSNGNASIIALPYKKGLKITYTLDDHGGVFQGAQMVELDVNEESFAQEIAPARTFCLAQEVDQLRAMGLGLGANYQNTCVFDGEKLIENEFRFPDEPARHKVLDLIGDLALSQRRINAHIIAIRSGHGENMALLKAIQKRVAEKEKPSLVLNIKEILEHLPHRYPMLMVDRIIDFEANKSIVGLKNVTINENYFNGHFPGNPVMPGVLQVESIAQTGAVMLLSSPGNYGKVPFFMSMDKVKFRRPVYPGDQMRIEVEAVRIRSRMAACKGRVLVDGKICCEAEIRSVYTDPT
ncbi:MAG: UDP-3-O-[3-hydroxymyristoyl] N-acetylglucosamine deacetylase [Planctomycetes bacterium]|nr:UDP-3-O-[3-hydroxymyristoyl] N-acetylglucosamine deacetylase [Planctomycetota bacterium]